VTAQECSKISLIPYPIGFPDGRMRFYGLTGLPARVFIPAGL
jgi:hypothetical protein